MHRYSFGPLAYVALGDKTSSKPTEAILANFSNNCLNQIYIYIDVSKSFPTVSMQILIGPFHAFHRTIYHISQGKRLDVPIYI